MSFFGGDVMCPECPKRVNRFGHNIGPRLECVESNYSGTGEDIGQCPECGKCWFISYKVDQIIRAQDFDGPSREEQEAEQLAEEAKKKEERRQQLKELKAEFGDDDDGSDD